MSIVPHAERIEFRPWREDDVETMLAIFGDPSVVALIDAAGPYDRSRAEARLVRELAGQRDHGAAYWPIFERATAGLVGCAGLRPRDSTARIFELGFALLPAWHGRGLATEAGRAVALHAFGPLGATALFAGHHPDNHASKRVLEKLGFRHTHDEPYAPTGALHPSYELVRKAQTSPAGTRA